ncbi:hypothetical protein ACCS70_24335 [Rhizobium ruizarguesonis]|jgi:hypothetical protein|uniref:Uncharacterized protein n=1 Tax=Rhizobium ruizarguesonis TaxID=2081791 RepID=A0AAE8QHF3_9HYPH|nr:MULTISPECIES: hypothetical protein [Rhizobium]QIO45615.1 hypothetical protein HA464_17385 [Rhizobium leguminosarum bv. trifolii]MBY5494405.1 hypothetical protein [Rhizobium leguminosarum]MBY5851751.1 hypothetical protein [Rhizobium leguminosarum]MBY5880042.1 hypothetical protein [Rhizobium leguminosarum]MBY5897768.1 hypothetical protein [Rhizobium leguminosarum]
MAAHGHNPILDLYGTQRAIIRSRVSARAKATTPPPSDQDDPAKIGSSIVSLTCLKDHEQTSR